MIRFIDISTGNVFNGSRPYVFWFDKEQSVNLNYIRKICVLTNRKSIEVSMESNDVFRFLDTTKMGEDIEIGGIKFKDLDNSGFATFSYTSQGAMYNNFFIHMLYILGKSNIASEYRQDFVITTADDQETFTVGADFYNEREELAINLANQGFEVPKIIEKAIYDFNIHEDGIDNILLNRKYKELLSEYINIINNKGSYKSLINSLSWFEYGDNIKIMELWKHLEPTREMFTQHDLKQTINTKFEDILTKEHKTTYIGLYLALTRVLLNDKNEIIYQKEPKYWHDIYSSIYGDNWEAAQTDVMLNDNKDRLLQIGEENINIDDYIDPSTPQIGGGANFIKFEHSSIHSISEPIPEISNCAAKWTSIDLALKMTMLNNFFSTYFMPIHLDLIHSTIENVVFTNTIKTFAWSVWSKKDYQYDINTFSCNLDNDYYIRDTKARVYPETCFGELWDDGCHDSMFGVDIIDKTSHIRSIICNNIQYDLDKNLNRIVSDIEYDAWVLTQDGTNHIVYSKSEDQAAIGSTIYTYNYLTGLMLEKGEIDDQLYEDGWTPFNGKSYKRWYIQYNLSARLSNNNNNLYTFIRDIDRDSIDSNNIIYLAWVYKDNVRYIREGDELNNETIFYTKPDPLDDEAYESRLQVIEYDDKYIKATSKDQDSTQIEIDEYQDRLKTFMQHRFEGLAAIIPFRCILHNVQKNMYITKANLQIIKKDSKDNPIIYTSYNITNDPTEVIKVGDRHINFNLLMKDSGEYKMVVDFVCGNGKHYMKSFNIRVSDDAVQSIKMYKIVKKDCNELQNLIPSNQDNILQYMFSQLNDSHALYRQFIATSNDVFKDKLGTNQFIVYEPQVYWYKDAIRYKCIYNLSIGGIRGHFEVKNINITTDTSIQDYIDQLNRAYGCHPISKEQPKFDSSQKGYYMFFRQDRLAIKAKQMVSFRWNEINSDKTNKISQLVNKYKNTQNLGYLYEAIQLLDPTPINPENPGDNYLHQSYWYIVVPYIVGINTMFNFDDTISITKNKEIGVVKNNMKYSAIASVDLDVKSMRPIVNINKINNNYTLYCLHCVYNYSSQSYEYQWKQINKIKTRSQSHSYRIPNICVIDNKLTLRFDFAKDCSKTITFDIPQTLNITHKYSNVTLPIYRDVMFNDGSIHNVLFNDTNTIYPITINDFQNTFNNIRYGKLFVQDKFIPLFHDLVEVPNKIIKKDEVVCFLPDITKTLTTTINKIGWTFKNVSTNDVIQPQIYKKWNETDEDTPILPIQPLLGRYDMEKIIDPGYYEVQLKYELLDSCGDKKIHQSKTNFIIEK